MFAQRPQSTIRQTVKVVERLVEEYVRHCKQMAKSRIDNGWRIGFCWCPTWAESSLLYNTYTFQMFHERMRTMPGVTTRLFKEPIECSRILPGMGCTPNAKVAIKWDQVSQYTNEAPTLGCIVHQDCKAKRNPMFIDRRTEWDDTWTWQFVSITRRIFLSSHHSNWDVKVTCQVTSHLLSLNMSQSHPTIICTDCRHYTISHTQWSTHTGAIQYSYNTSTENVVASNQVYWISDSRCTN